MTMSEADRRELAEIARVDADVQALRDSVPHTFEERLAYDRARGLDFTAPDMRQLMFAVLASGPSLRVSADQRGALLKAGGTTIRIDDPATLRALADAFGTVATEQGA